MRQHHKKLQMSGKTRRRKAWERGKEILKDKLADRRKLTDEPLIKRERRHMFAEARKQARREMSRRSS